MNNGGVQQLQSTWGIQLRSCSMVPNTETLYGHSIVLQRVNWSKAQVKVELSKFEIQEKLKWMSLSETEVNVSFKWISDEC